MAGRPPCAAIDGWQGRVAAKLGGSAAVGAAAGAFLAVLRAGPLPRFVAGTAGSCALAAGVFSCAQEAARAARCGVGPANSAFGGAVAGYALTAIHTGSRPRGAGVAVVAAPAAAAAHAGLDWATGGRGLLRPMLERTGLLDLDATTRATRDAAAAARHAADVQAAGRPLPWYLAWLPMRRMTPEEVVERKARKDAEFRAARDAADAGGLGAAVERARARGEGR